VLTHNTREHTKYTEEVTMKALSPELKAKAKAVIDGRSMKIRANRDNLEALANEVNRPYVSRKGFAGRGESNFETNGEVVDKKTIVGKLEDGVYMVKGGVCKKMKTRNRLGAVICVTYRTLPKKKDGVAAMPDKKAQAKGTKKAAVTTVPDKKAQAKVTKKATKKVAVATVPDKKAQAGKGKRRR